MEYITYKGWQRCVALGNDSVELIIVADIGPRIISYKLAKDNAENVFMEFEDQAGASGEREWMIRGGHRLWVAPEQIPLTYTPDNEEVPHEPVGDHGILLVNPATQDNPFRKEMIVRIASNSPRIRVDHRLVNDGDEPAAAAPWALSVMKPGAQLIIPQLLPGEHALDLLPNRRVILWPFSSLSDARFQPGTRYWRVRQADHPKPFKLGLNLQTGWVCCALGSTLFVKSVPYNPEAEYTDEGSNFEIYTNNQMLEIETLGEFVELEPGEAVEHTENWWLFDLGTPLPADELEIREWLRPALEKTGLHLP